MIVVYNYATTGHTYDHITLYEIHTHTIHLDFWCIVSPTNILEFQNKIEMWTLQNGWVTLYLAALLISTKVTWGQRKRAMSN